jgi:hypothetical protein
MLVEQPPPPHPRAPAAPPSMEEIDMLLLTLLGRCTDERDGRSRLFGKLVGVVIGGGGPLDRDGGGYAKECECCAC